MGAGTAGLPCNWRALCSLIDRVAKTAKQKIMKRKRGGRLLLPLIYAAAILTTLTAAAGFLFFWLVDVPSINNFQEREVVQSTKIFDRSGEELLWEIYGEERRTVVPFNQISRHMKNATVALEDSSFYSHKGISPLSMLRAFIVDVLSGKIEQGGSTITQQLVKNTLLVPKQTITRKAKEIVIAAKLDGVYSKDEILGLYLNEIPYGSNAYGVEAAAQTFFGKSSADVTLAEASYLASLPQAPSYYSPYGNHRDELEKRKNIAIRRMFELGFITTEELEEAKNERVSFRPPSDRGIKAPHFVIYVREQLESLFDENFIKGKGLRVTTTLDLQLQQRAEEIVARYGEINEQQFGATNAGLVAINPRTGEVLAMVGSRNYFDTEREGNFNVTLARRQPGSAFKPIVYATAFKKGYTPNTTVFDLETEFAVQGAGSYIPQNYDEKYRGPVTLREALAQSLNIPSVKTLYLAGLGNALATAKDLGITTLNEPDRYGLTLVLGGGEVSLLELTSAYGVFAADGMRVPYSSILKIENNDGSELFKHEAMPVRALTPEISRTVTNILSDNEARAPAFGQQSPLYFEQYAVAAKTGTTNDSRDAWIIGYNPKIAVGAWAGNNDNSSMEKKIAGFIVAPFWREFMDYALIRVRAEEVGFVDPPIYENNGKPVLNAEWRGSETYVIDKVSGKLATDFTPPVFREEKIIRSVHTILHWIDKDNPQGPIPQNPQQDSQYTNWEGPVRKWVEENNIEEDERSVVPADFDNVHSPELEPTITLRHPIEGLFGPNDTVEVFINASSKRALGQLDVFFNEDFVRSQKDTYNKILLDLKTVSVIGNKNILTLRLYDDVGNRGELRIPIEIEF
ncbi:MAG: hypothetical protein A3C80_04140 [Candidatus Ryanbacteria bacterium RIFCSPHIGHO2_02_FULL_45_43]|uniref:Uncharacterized protein n=1 Tax=Candidatus Ryanbacteria bacterium RIFCSPHIGHO2_01_45_13 TaxID=1802112 RepID=A0A1G2G0F1_9BACT|nr:MAG: hypothetical protein A2W41_01195 [Candidatus Ryanbacteria bacterium RIFCSPHIGHO2_01_45_13]OGZ48226.1 MAG: hypothetical protein A3C80_04140 [Candidatus Ryanbacteria bacterium RIFCSPHIGHO2_02_FULL_45_43]OGZ50002.1 MAG: hypothetical protein A3E55_01800 [Candidatus Ryanbacteria bacterium RIFCSPHIGHO2_12_FULL_44_20]OGZ51461.1 MAG: hypothetical protein A3A17_01750 [Candidatus Ryanbacteria bacterium RIFCSPLOWO2_01_FULL_44_230]OGZ54496.1 MAG: hypothetical protein A3H62_03750 [Candidatus Ryanbac